MSLPINYRNSEAQILNSYSFLDIISGAAYQLFYPANSKNQTTEYYHLATQQINSNTDVKIVTINPSTANFTLFSDIDYDITTTLPRTIFGTGIITIPHDSDGPPGNTKEYYFIVKLRKYSGTTETDIISCQSPTFSAPEGADVTWTGNMVIPKTNFSVNDIIRLTIEVWGKNTDSSNGFTVDYGQDPDNHTTTLSVGARSTFYCPFKPDL